MADIDPRAARHGHLIKERRLDLGLNRPAFVTEMRRHGQEITPDYLNKLESGRAPLARASVEVREAIRAVLGWDADTWFEKTGLFSPAATSGRRPPPVPPVVDPIEMPLVIPDALQQMIDEHGGRYSQLHNERALRILTAPRLFGGPTEGPQTADQWLDYFLMIRGYLPK